jgi:hypothetical protein
LWKKLVRMFHPDQYEHDPEKRRTYERLTQAINEARDRGDIELLELIAKDPQAFILKQGWGWRGLDAGRMTMLTNGGGTPPSRPAAGRFSHGNQGVAQAP